MLDERDKVLPLIEFTFNQRVTSTHTYLKTLSRAITQVWNCAVGSQRKKLVALFDLGQGQRRFTEVTSEPGLKGTKIF